MAKLQNGIETVQKIQLVVLTNVPNDRQQTGRFVTLHVRVVKDL